MNRLAPVALLAVMSLAAASPPVKTPAEIVASAPTSDWRDVLPEDLLVMQLAGGATVAIELAPIFAPVHVANIRALVRGGWFDGNAIVRVQDDYVVQWGGAMPGRRLPPGVVPHPAAEYDRPLAGMTLVPLASRDAYAPRVGFVDGWPVASDGERVWPTHCYAMVGVGRDMPPDSGDGSELYAVIGQAPRHLDRNIVLAGRILDGMATLSALPRGTADMGFYADAARNVPIRHAWIAVDMPAAARPRYQVLRPGTASFAAYVDARANRRDPFFVRPAGGVDLCNVPVPTRRAG